MEEKSDGRHHMLGRKREAESSLAHLGPSLFFLLILGLLLVIVLGAYSWLCAWGTRYARD